MENCYNFALIPEQSFADKCVSLSQSIAAQLPSQYILGENSLAHNSVLQFKDCPFELVKGIQNDLSELFEKDYLIDTYNIGFTPDGDRAWIGLTVLKNDALATLHEALLSHPDVQAHMELVNNSTGDRYAPHFTLGMVENQSHYPKLDIPLGQDPFFTQNIPCRLHLGNVGPNWQYAGIIKG